MWYYVETRCSPVVYKIVSSNHMSDTDTAIEKNVFSVLLKQNIFASLPFKVLTCGPIEFFSHSSQCFTTGVTKDVVCVILSVG